MPLQLKDLEDDIAKFLKERFPTFAPRVLVDVGANEAWFSLSFLREFADLHCWLIEPTPPQFEKMQDYLRRYGPEGAFERAHCFRLAFDMAPGSGRITTVPNVTVNHLVDAATAAGVETAPVDIVVGDAFCAEHNVEHIDFLKIDAEGFDFRVLLGFKDMLSRQAVDFIQAEVGISSSNKRHVPLHCVSGLLEAFGYEVFRINNQCSGRRPVLEWADAVFISDKAAIRLTSS